MLFSGAGAVDFRKIAVFFVVCVLIGRIFFRNNSGSRLTWVFVCHRDLPGKDESAETGEAMSAIVNWS